MWRASILTIFPRHVSGAARFQPGGQSADGRLWTLDAVDIRAYATDRHRSVTTPRRVAVRAWSCGPTCWPAPSMRRRPRRPAPAPGMSPRGVPLTQERVEALAQGPGAGHSLRPASRAWRTRDRSAQLRGNLDRRLCPFGRRSCGRRPARRLLSGSCPASWARRPRARRRALPTALLEYPQYTRPQLWEGVGTDPRVLTAVITPRSPPGRRPRRTAHPRASSRPLGGACGPAGHLAKQPRKRPDRKPSQTGDKASPGRISSARPVQHKTARPAMSALR